MNGNTIWTIVALIIIVGVGWFLLKGTPAKAPSPDVTNQTQVVGSTTPEVTVTYTDQGFSPKEIAVSLGTTVNFVNRSSDKMWVASAVHPTHTAYSGTSLSQHCPDTASSAFDECAGDEPGKTYSFTFNKEGTWKYHDHINSKMFGSVTVTASSASATPVLQN